MDSKLKFINKKVLPYREGESYFLISGNDSVKAGNDFAKAGNDFAKAGNDFGKAGNDFGKAGNDFGKAGNDFGKAGNDFGKAGNDIGKAGNDFGKAGYDIGKAGYEILQSKMLISCLFLRFLSFLTNFEVKNSYTFIKCPAVGSFSRQILLKNI